MHTLAASGSSPTDTIAGIFGVAGLVVAYWAPTIIAYFRHVQGFGQIVVVNTFAFFFLFPWVIALVMAFRHVPAAPGQVLRPPNGV